MFNVCPPNSPIILPNVPILLKFKNQALSCARQPSHQSKSFKALVILNESYLSNVTCSFIMKDGSTKTKNWSNPECIGNGLHAFYCDS